jgi:hypothetical protein
LIWFTTGTGRLLYMRYWTLELKEKYVDFIEQLRIEQLLDENSAKWS